MLELFINNKKVDLTEDLDIQFTYKSLDVTDPTVIRNNFSTTVSLKGTKTNNEIFGNIYRLDASSLNFDVTKRVSFRLTDNGSVVESGYMQLNSIDRAFNDVTYNITLYGGLGDFFYSLMYNEDGTERTMKDMYYGWYEDKLSEDVSIITQNSEITVPIQWNKYNAAEPVYDDAVNYVLSKYLGKQSFFTFHNGNLLYNETDRYSLHTNHKPIPLFNVFDCELEISMTDYAGTDEMCCFITSSADIDMNHISNVQYIISLKDIVEATELSGSYKLELNSQMKYLWVTASDSMTVKTNINIYSGYALKQPHSYVREHNYVDVDMSLETGKIVNYDYVGTENIAYAIAGVSPGNTTQQTIFFPGIKGTMTKPLSLGAVLLDDLGNVVYTYKYDIVQGDVTDLRTCMIKITVPGTGTQLNYDVLLGYHNDLGVYTSASGYRYYQSDIKAIPTYSGLYDDFDNNKVMINVLSVPGSLFPRNSGDYHLYKGKYAMVELPRDAVEWEVRTLNPLYQRMGVKLSSLLGACSNSDFNGGYNVLFDTSIYKSPYYKDSWLIFNRPDYSEMVSQSLEMYGEITNDLYYWEDKVTQYVPPIRNFNSNDILFKGNLDLQIGFPDFRPSEYLKYSSRLVLVSDYDQSGTTPTEQRLNNYAGYVVRLVAKKGDEVLGVSNAQFISFNRSVESGWYVEYNRAYKVVKKYDYRDRFLKQIMDIVNIWPWNKGKQIPSLQNNCFVYVNKNNTPITFDAFDKTNAIQNFRVPVEFSFPTEIAEQDVDIYLDVDIIYTKLQENGQAEVYYAAGDNNYFWTVMSGGNENLYYNIAQAGGPNAYTNLNISLDILNQLTNKSLSDGAINKSVLFKDSSSPFKYLTDFTKLMNYKYIFNNETKTIFITDKYYKNEVEELTVDYGRTININPTNLSTNKVEVGMESPETYAANLLKQNSDVAYGTVSVNTGYEFNNDTLEVIKDNIYKNVIPYKLISHFFTDYQDVPPFAVFSKMVYHLYKSNGDNNKMNINPLSDKDYSPTELYYDFEPKLCMFTDDNKSANCMNSLAFFAGLSSVDYSLPDTLALDDMLNMNDNTPCHYYDGKAGIKVPLFLKTNKDGYSWNVSVPKYQFNQSEMNTISNTVYDYWNGYVSDLYNTETKQITVWAHLTSAPKDAMRKFYYVDNQYWIITEIKNYSAYSYFNQVVLTKVNDRNNYVGQP